MRAFVELYNRLDATTRNTEKVAALAAYFRSAPPSDAAWTLALLSGRRLPRPVQTPKLRAWAAQLAGVPDWLFDEAYDAVGDLSETIALLVAAAPDVAAGDAAADVPAALLTLTLDSPLDAWVTQVLIPLRTQVEDVQRAWLTHIWRTLPPRAAFLFNKLAGGQFRVGVSQALVLQALAQVSGTPEPALAHRLMGDWVPSADFYHRLLAPEGDGGNPATPYPFYLAYALEDDLAALGEPAAWQAEYKWDGIRAQLIRREGQVFVWSRGEELITERFPELAELGLLLPEGTVLDGELLPWLPGAGQPLPFAALQRRIGRKVLSKKILAEVPARLVAFDLLEWDGEDLRERPLADRRALLEALVQSLPGDAPVHASPAVPIADWKTLAQVQAAAREVCAEGLMLKRLDSAYRTGRRKGDWWKWKLAPYTVDAVMVYAQRGTGRRASLYTDYTFAVWAPDPAAEGGRTLVPFAKAYSGLTDAEIREVDSWVRRHTLAKFGPVRTVAPQQVFELAFEGIQRSPRHKSGVAVRFPRIVRWRKDKPAAEADTLATLQQLMA